MKRLVSILVVVLLILAGIAMLTQGKTGRSVPGNKIEVTTSFYPLYYFASRVGGDKVNVSNITPAAAEPHDYEPTSQDIARIEKSSLLILNGGVEAWGGKIKSNLQGTNTVIITAGDGLLNKQLTEAGKTVIDPHVWLDPQLAKVEIDKITKGLEQVDPKDKDYFSANKAKLDAELDTIDREYKRGLISCQEKDMITSHAAFGYLAARYGLNQVPIAGLSPDAEPSSQQLADIVTFAKVHHTKYIFFESLVSPKLSDTIAQEIGAKTLVLDPLEGITDDERKKGADFITIMRQNLTNLQTALGCTH